MEKHRSTVIPSQIDQWVGTFLVDRQIRNVSHGTLEFYELKLFPFQEWCHDNRIDDPINLVPGHIRSYLLHLNQRGHNPGGIHCHYRALKTLLRFFEDEEEPENWRNPINRVPAPKVRQEPLAPVELPQVKQLIESRNPRTFHGVRDRSIFLVLLESGVRAGELMAMNVDDLDMGNGSILIREGKGGKVRVVVIGRSVQKQIRKWLRVRSYGAEPLFCSQDGGRLTYSGLRGILNRALRQTGIEDVSLHDFRRAFCLNQLQAGVPETTIARLMGHSSTQLIARYAKQTPRDLIESFHSVVDRGLK
jgi:integrase/recombinase XerD